jgi:radical SAM superfamily enzyme YgiQ (UPF0313 family)
MYTKVFLRLEPLGLELVAESLRRAGHDVRLMDLQVQSHADFLYELDAWRPDAVCFSLNYLANVPEIVDLAKAAKTRLPECFTFVGGHSASFVAKDLLKHGEGLLDCVCCGAKAKQAHPGCWRPSPVAAMSTRCRARSA